MTQTNEEYIGAKGKFKGHHLTSAIQSASIELISGVSADMGIKLTDSSQVQVVTSDFIFALNDQNLEKNKIENPLIICAEVKKQNWNKI
jgi:hypothetical protein